MITMDKTTCSTSLSTETSALPSPHAADTSTSNDVAGENQEGIISKKDEEPNNDDDGSGSKPMEETVPSHVNHSAEDGNEVDRMIGNRRGNVDEEATGGTDNSSKRKIDDEGPLPTLPLKKARTAYFIFADEKREELKLLHKGEGVAVIARATGQLWSALSPTQRETYERLSAQERGRVSRDMQRLKDAGMWPESTAPNASVDGNPILPVARIRKICKLDPEVRGMSKEAIVLVTRATELFVASLGRDCVTVAQMQNRRKLLPEDVVEVCSTKEKFLFLREDLKDLVREALSKDKKEKVEDGGKGLNTLDSFFRKVR